PLNELMKKTAGEPEDCSSLLIIGMTACCGIEAMGRFAFGSAPANNKRFKDFAAGYLDPVLQQHVFGKPVTTYLWDNFRNGLAHGFAVCHGGFEGDKSNYYAVRNYAGYDVIQVSPGCLVDDVANGFQKFIAVLRADCPAGQTHQI